MEGLDHRVDVTRTLAIHAECGPAGKGVVALVCEGEGWRVREDVIDGEFDLAYSRLLSGLRRRLRLTDRQMQHLESRRYLVGNACRHSSEAA